MNFLSKKSGVQQNYIFVYQTKEIYP